MKNASLLFCTVLSLLLAACLNKPNLASEEKELRELLRQERKAHFDRNVELFVSEFADSMVNVNKGKVTIKSIDEHKQRIGTYFGSVTFIKWDDVADPLIRFSNDGTLAYAIVQKQVILSYPDSLGVPFIDTTDYAWVSIYRKQQGQWKVETNISTNK